MRITIDVDSAGVSVGNTAAQASAAANTGAESAGAGPESTGAASQLTGDSANTGGPPQWLLDAVNKVIAEAGDTAGIDSTQAADGGAGPAS